jgi:hypothetical protein
MHVSQISYTVTIIIIIIIIIIAYMFRRGKATLCYKPEGRGFDSRWGHWDFSLT